MNGNWYMKFNFKYNFIRLVKTRQKPNCVESKIAK